MKRAVFRFRGVLNDFLVSERRDGPFPYAFEGKPSVKDAIEAIGIPHVEVDVIIRNAVSVPFTAHLREDDAVEVFPPGEGSGIPGSIHLWPEPLSAPKFVLDVHLGKLAKYLRLLGFDCLHENRYSDTEIAAVSAGQDRVALTRDVALLKNGIVRRGLWIRSRNPREQLVEVLRRYHLDDCVRPFTRCIVCNGPVGTVSKVSVRDMLQPGTAKNFDRFSRCGTCGRIYWEGSHYMRMREIVDEALGNLKRESGERS